MKLCFSGLIQAGDIVAIAVEWLGFVAFFCAQHPFCALAPAGMRDIGVHIRDKSIFGGVDGIPEGGGLVFGQPDFYSP